MYWTTGTSLSAALRAFRQVPDQQMSSRLLKRPKEEESKQERMKANGEEAMIDSAHTQSLQVHFVGIVGCDNKSCIIDVVKKKWRWFISVWALAQGQSLG